MRQFEVIMNENYQKTMLFVRDLVLDPKFVACYSKGQIVTDPSFIEMTYKVGGMNPEMNTRFVILSNRASNMQELEEDTNWGLYVIHTHAYFKVLNCFPIQEKNIIVLLHIKEEDIDFFQTHEVSLDSLLSQQVKEKMDFALSSDVVAELDSDLWYRHTNYPIGVKEDGTYFQPKEELN